MKRSEELLKGTADLIKIIEAELKLYGLGETARKVIISQIVDVWDVGGRHALELLRESQGLDKASLN